jgi:hypothetical protein
LKPGLDFLSLEARGYQEEGMIRRSIPQNEEIRRTAEDTAIAGNNTLIRRKGDISDALTTQRSGARFIAPMDTIWKSVKHFWIVKRCCPQHCRHPKIPVGGTSPRGLRRRRAYGRNQHDFQG